MDRAPRPVPRCQACHERIGVYEPVWCVAPDGAVERTSWLRLGAAGLEEPLWHERCAEQEGIDGG
jgi:hypothetical protein